MSTLTAAHGAVTTLFSNLFVTLPVPKPERDLSKQVFIVTGSNVGLGLETSRHLLRLGAGKLIMGVRNVTKGEAAKKDLLSSTGREEFSTEVWHLDHDNSDSVKAFAARVNDLPRLDGVLANAGVATTKFNLSEGHEKILNINVISTFLLFFLLLPKMRESEQATGNPCTFTIPNSALHYLAPITELSPPENIFARLNDKDQAKMSGRYPLSKLLVLWIVRELADKCKGSPIINTPNPSFCKSELMRGEEYDSQRGVAEKLARTTEEGSRTLYHGLFAGKDSDGQYLHNCHIQTPARHVTNQLGQKTQKAVYAELVNALETIQPGISLNLKASDVPHQAPDASTRKPCLTSNRESVAT